MVSWGSLMVLERLLVCARLSCTLESGCVVYPLHMMHRVHSLTLRLLKPISGLNSCRRPIRYQVTFDTIPLDVLLKGLLNPFAYEGYASSSWGINHDRDLAIHDRRDLAGPNVHLRGSWAFLVLGNCNPVAISFLSIDLLQERVPLVLLSSEVLSLNDFLYQLDILLMKLWPPIHGKNLIRMIRSCCERVTSW
jgi:hypothetical protein